MCKTKKKKSRQKNVEAKSICHLGLQIQKKEIPNHIKENQTKTKIKIRVSHKNHPRSHMTLGGHR